MDSNYKDMEKIEHNGMNNIESCYSKLRICYSIVLAYFRCEGFALWIQELMYLILPLRLRVSFLDSFASCAFMCRYVGPLARYLNQCDNVKLIPLLGFNSPHFICLPTHLSLRYWKLSEGIGGISETFNPLDNRSNVSPVVVWFIFCDRNGGIFFGLSMDVVVKETTKVG